MAVELAKVSLWLHSFTVGAPLSFLDHHLRCGDSVIGAWTRPTVDWLKARGALFNTSAIASVEQVARVMESIEEKTDSDIAEVTASKKRFRRRRGGDEADRRPVFSVLTAERMMGVFDGAPKKAPPAAEKMAGQVGEAARSVWREQVRAFDAASAFGLALEGAFGDPFKIASRRNRGSRRRNWSSNFRSSRGRERSAIKSFSENQRRRSSPCARRSAHCATLAHARRDTASSIGKSASPTSGRTCSRPSPRAVSTR